MCVEREREREGVLAEVDGSSDDGECHSHRCQKVGMAVWVQRLRRRRMMHHHHPLFILLPLPLLLLLLLVNPPILYGVHF